MHSEKRARSFKIYIQVEEELYYPCSVNKGADQLCSYCEAELRLCFRLCMLLIFLCSGSFLTSTIGCTLYKMFTNYEQQRFFTEIIFFSIDPSKRQTVNEPTYDQTNIIITSNSGIYSQPLRSEPQTNIIITSYSRFKASSRSPK